LRLNQLREHSVDELPPPLRGVGLRAHRRRQLLATGSLREVEPRALLDRVSERDAAPWGREADLDAVALGPRRPEDRFGGLASAPPYSGCSTGVSTSRKPCSSSHPRTALTTAARFSNSSRVSGLAIRSSSRWRYRSSTSSSPWYLSGGGRRLFASNAHPSSR